MKFLVIISGPTASSRETIIRPLIQDGYKLASEHDIQNMLNRESKIVAEISDTEAIARTVAKAKEKGFYACLCKWEKK